MVISHAREVNGIWYIFQARTYLFNSKSVKNSFQSKNLPKASRSVVNFVISFASKIFENKINNISNPVKKSNFLAGFFVA